MVLLHDSTLARHLLLKNRTTTSLLRISFELAMHYYSNRSDVLHYSLAYTGWPAELAVSEFGGPACRSPFCRWAVGKLVAML